MKHWALAYIGKPWVAGGRGPIDMDCWGLAIQVYKEQLGVDLPEFHSIGARDTKSVAKTFNTQTFARLVTKPQEFDLVGMSMNKNEHHVGIFVEEQGGGILHNQENSGVVFSSLLHIKQLGYTNLNYYRYV